MKILTGKFKGRNFYMPHGIRPTSNLIRKAVFDILGQDLSGINFLELYAGSGAVGFEALSLGAQRVTWVENDPRCIQIIEENVRLLGLEQRAETGGFYEVVHGDVFYAVKQWAKSGRKFDWVFLDPPYGAELAPQSGTRAPSLVTGKKVEGTLAKKTLNLLVEHDILTPNCLVIVQSDKFETLPETSGRFLLIRQKKYGTSTLSIYQGKVSGSIS